MVGQDAQPGRGGTLRAAALAVRGTQVGGRQPCGGTTIGTTPIAGPGGDLQLVAGESRVAEPQSGLCRGHAHRRRLPTASRDVRGRSRSVPPAPAISSLHDDSGRLGRDPARRIRRSRPTRSGRPSGTPRRAANASRVGGVRVVLGEAGPSEEQARFGEVHHVADTLERTDGEFGVLARLVVQAGGDHQLAPIGGEHARAPAGIADAGVQRIGAGERRQRGDDVALQPGGECVVVGGASREEELPVVGGETLRDRGVREGFVDLAPVGEHDCSVAPQPRLEHTVVAPGDERERARVRLERFGRTAQLLDHDGPLHLEITAFFGRQLVDRPSRRWRALLRTVPARRPPTRARCVSCATRARSSSSSPTSMAARRWCSASGRRLSSRSARRLSPRARPGGPVRDVLACTRIVGRRERLGRRILTRPRAQRTQPRAAASSRTSRHVRQYCRYHVRSQVLITGSAQRRSRHEAVPRSSAPTIPRPRRVNRASARCSRRAARSSTDQGRRSSTCAASTMEAIHRRRSSSAIGKLAGVELRTDETDVAQFDRSRFLRVYFDPRVDVTDLLRRVDRRDRAGSCRAQHRVPDRFVHRRPDALLRLRRRPDALLVGFGADPMHFSNSSTARPSVRPSLLDDFRG